MDWEDCFRNVNLRCDSGYKIRSGNGHRRGKGRVAKSVDFKSNLDNLYVNNAYIV